MAFMPANRTLPCNYSDIDVFFTDAIQTNSSINLTVQDCPHLCDLAWGSGNPDLSGPGV